MAFKDLIKHAQELEKQGKKPAGAKSSQQIRRDAIERGVLPGLTAEAAEPKIQGRTQPQIQKLQVQEKKEATMAEKNPVDSLYLRKKFAENALKKFDESDREADIDWTDTNARKAYNSKRQRLQDAVDRAGAELDARENERYRAEIDAMDEEDRQLLAEYVENQDQRRSFFGQSNPIAWFQSYNKEEDNKNALFEKYGQERLDELAEIYRRNTYARQAEEEAAKAQAAVNKGTLSAIGQNILSVPLNVLTGVEALASRAYEAIDRTGQYNTLNPYNYGDVGMAYGQGVRQQTVQNIEGEDPNLLRKGASIGYQGVMAAADSVARAFLGGGAAGGATLAATNSFAQTMSEASQQGATPAQAAIMATTTAGIEYLTEKIPLDNLIKTAKGTGLNSAVKNALRQAGIEAATEEISLMATVLAEAAILQEKSAYQQKITGLVMQGVNPEEARRQANMDIVNEAINTLLVSAVSGSVSSAAGSYADYRGMFAAEQERSNPELAKPKAKNAEQARAELLQKYPELAQQQEQTTEAAQQPQTQPQTEVQQEMVQEQTPAVQPQQEAQTTPQVQQQASAPTVDTQKESSQGGQPETTWRELANRLDNKKESNPSRIIDDIGIAVAKEVVNTAEKGTTASELKKLSDDAMAEYEALQASVPHGKSYTESQKATLTALYNMYSYYDTLSKNPNFLPMLKQGIADGEAELSGITTEQTQQPQNQQTVPNTEQVQQNQSTNVDENAQQIKGTGAAEQNFTGKAKYQELLTDDNTQRDRPGDVRPMEVPKTDSYGRKVSEFVGNAYGAEATPDRMANEIETLVQEGALGFDKRTNKESLENARAFIYGTEGKKGKGEAAVRTSITRNIANGKIQDGDVEKALLLYTKYANRKSESSQESAAELLVDLATMANMTGRNLQMFKLLRRMTPQGQLMAVQKEIQRNTEKMIKSGSVKKGFAAKPNTELEQEYMSAAKDALNAKTDKARTEAEQSMKELQEAMYMDAASQMPATFKAKWDAWRYMAMLGNVKTQVRNVVGNLAFEPYVAVKNKMGALAEKLLVPKENRTKSLTTDWELRKWARQDGRSEMVQDALKYSAKLGDDVSTQKLSDQRKIFDNKALESMRKFVEKIPQETDLKFKNNYYERAMAGFLKARGYTATDAQNGGIPPAILEEARTYSIQEAMKATFNDSNAFSDFLATGLRYNGENKVGKALNIAGESILPFRRTPANIMVRFTEYSPLGVVKTITDGATKVRNGEMTAATLIDELCSNLTGSAAMALGYMLAGGVNGIKITGSGTDEDEKRQGHQDFALEFSRNGEEYSYRIDWSAPANLPLFVGANIRSAIESAGEDADVSRFTSFLRGLGTAFEPMLALSCMSSLNDLLEGIGYAQEEGTELYTIASKIATGYITQGIPALARQSAQAAQENSRTTLVTSDDPTVRDVQSFAAGSLPFVGEKYKTDKVTAWGEKESKGTTGERIFNAFFNPGTRKKIDNSSLEQEISRINSTPGNNVTPPYMPKTITYTDSDGNTHENYRLSEQEYQAVAQTQGQTARRILGTMISSDNYKAMSDAEKAKAINQVYSYARVKAQVDNIENHTGYDEAWMMDLKEGKEAEEILRQTTNNVINSAMTSLQSAWDNGYKADSRSNDLEAAYDSYEAMTPAQKREVREFATGNAAIYLESRASGTSHKQTVDAIRKVENLKPERDEDGKPYREPRDIQKWETVAGTIMSDKGKDALMKAYMTDYNPDSRSPDTTELKYDYAREVLNLSPEQFAETYRVSMQGKKDEKIQKWIDMGYTKEQAQQFYNLYSAKGKTKIDVVDWHENN